MTVAIIAAIIALASSARAQFDPLNGEWGKSDIDHVRVMTWNIEDGVCSTNFKTDTVGNWNGIVRILASLQPDILILQEAGDNSGNGTGSSLDSVANLEATIHLLFRGGVDPFRGGNVSSFIQQFSADSNYDLPHVFVSELSDFGLNSGFNRNVILSRWPFADLNGDGISKYNDIPPVDSPFGSIGNGGIRGVQFAEIDLPDDRFGGDLVIFNGHFKSGGGSSNENQRVSAGKNVGWFIHQIYNGAGTGVVDPDDTVFDNPEPTRILDELTPVIGGGDLNMDNNAPLLNPSNIKAAAEWLAQGLDEGGVDGNDRDLTDMTNDSAPRVTITFSGQVVDGSPLTNSAGKIDHLIHQSSIAGIARQFVFDTFELNGIFPAPITTYPGQGFEISKDASDHWPVIVDYILPEPVQGATPDLDNDGEVGASDLALLLGAWGACSDPMLCPSDLDGSGDVGAADLALLLGAWGPLP